jgi:hypothetical protein
LAIKLNKKGIVFSLIALLVSTLFIIVFSVFLHVPLNQRAIIELESVKKAEDFLIVFPTYLDTSIQFSSYETLKVILAKTSLENPIDNFSKMFTDCMLYGEYFDGTQIKDCFTAEKDNTLTNVLNDIADQASEIYRGNCSTYITNLNVYQSNPYEITVDAKVLLFFQRGKKIQWERNYDVSTKVSIIGLNDPLTKGKLNRTINVKSEYFTMKNIQSYSDFYDIYRNNYYFIDYFAPSFVDVIEGKINETEFDSGKQLGINSLMSAYLIDGSSSYKMNTSFISWDYVRNKKYNQTDLYLISYNNLQKLNLTYPYLHLTNRMNLSYSSLWPSNSYPCSCNENGCTC